MKLTYLYRYQLAQERRNFLVGFAFRQQLHNLSLAGRQLLALLFFGSFGGSPVEDAIENDAGRS
jgi:hypothetical protein